MEIKTVTGKLVQLAADLHAWALERKYYLLEEKLALHRTRIQKQKRIVEHENLHLLELEDELTSLSSEVGEELAAIEAELAALPPESV